MTISTHQPALPLGTPDWVYIPCPATLALEASTLVADLITRRGVNEGHEVLVATPTGDLAPADPASRGSFSTRVGNANGVWNGDGYAALRAKNTLSARRAVAIGDALSAAGAEHLVAMSDLAERTAMTTSEVRSALGKLSQFVALNRDVFPDYVWPFGWWFGREIDPNHPREFHYVMSVEQRSAWETHR